MKTWLTLIQKAQELIVPLLLSNEKYKMWLLTMHPNYARVTEIDVHQITNSSYLVENSLTLPIL